MNWHDEVSDALLQEAEDASEVDFVVLRVIKGAIYYLFAARVLHFIRVDVVRAQTVLRLIFLPVEKSLQVSQCVVCNTLVKFSLNFAFASGIHALVVDNELPRLGVARGLHAYVVTFIIDFEEMAEEQVDLVADVFVGNVLLALFASHARYLRLVVSLVDAREFNLFLAGRLRADQSEAGNGTLFQILLCLCLQDGVGEVRVVVVLVIGHSV